MAATTILRQLLLLALIVTSTLSTYCDAPSPAFPPPQLDSKTHASKLHKTTNRITRAVEDIISRDEFNTTHLSLEITSQFSGLLSIQHTARERSELRPGATRITDRSMYRIASMTKPFTVLALFQLQKAGKLDLDVPISLYLPELNKTGTGKGRGGLPFKDITLRALASQITGIPRDLAQQDVVNSPDEADRLGLPPLPDVGRFKGDYNLPDCDQNVNYTRACNSTDLLDWVDQLSPLFAPNQKSTYSNINFDLLGLVIAKVSGMTYEEYIETDILREIGMNDTSFNTPPDAVAAVARGIEFYWPFEIGVQNPTGGLYSSSSEMSIWLRYVLRTFNAQATGVNWFNPTSFSGSLDTYYGMPWEIFRAKTNDVISDTSNSTRPLTFITKGGGLPGYTSNVVMIPGYGLGITILIAGDGKALREILEVVTREIVAFAEQAALDELWHRYAGVFNDSASNSTMDLAVSNHDGLHITHFISNSRDVKAAIDLEDEQMVFHLMPTLLYVNEEKQRGERWRIIPQKRRSNASGKGKVSVWDNFCVSDVSWIMYAGKPVNEVVFWSEGVGEGQRMGQVELTGFRKVLRRQEEEESGEVAFGMVEQF